MTLLYQMQRPLDDLLLIAHCELMSNPTISMYKMMDGAEIRRPANSMQRLAESIDRTLKAFENMGTALIAVGEAANRFMGDEGKR